MTLVPVLETERLIMREIKPSDFDSFAAFYASDSSKYIGGPVDRESAWRKLALFAGQWSLNGYGEWALEVKKTGEFAGLCGPWYPEGWPEREIAWALMLGHYGKGYAIEASNRALQFAYQNLGWTTAISLIDQANTASIKLAKRLGAKLERDCQVMGSAGSIYRHLDPQQHARVCNYG
jgi:ribosomal-protein-alanine N-acetyltransferase